MSNHINEPTEEEMGFIRAVLANPDDDAIRLAYSDWLEEQGRETYKTIRMQAELKYDIAHYDYWLSEDHCKNRRYETTYCEWYRRDSKVDYLNPLSYFFAFREYLRCPAEWWLKNADMVTKYHPIREVHLTTWPQIADVSAMLRQHESIWQLHTDCSAEYYFVWVAGMCWPQITFVLPNGERIGHEADTATPQAT